MEQRIKINKWQKTTIVVVLILFVSAGMFSLGYLFGTGRLKIRQFASENTTLPQNLDYSGVEQVYDELKSSFDGQLDQEKLLDGLKAGLVQAAGDPYTEYMSKKDAQEFNDQLDGSFEGIGAELSKEKNNIIIVSPISGSPADKAGLKPRDIIAKVDGETTYGMNISQAVDKIRGKAGTVVTLELVRSGKPLEVKITRDVIKIPSVEHSMLKGDIGYLRVSRFASDTTKLAEQAAKEFKSKNAKGVILDVRGNPGGLLDQAVGISSLWIDEGKTVLEERRAGEVIKVHDATGGNVLSGIPTVVLIDEGSASASEIVAGALSDQHAATLMGVKSFGKGSVQDVEQLVGGAILKVTIARWYTPNGRNIDKQGIQPDKTVKLSGKTDNQKQSALNFLLK